ncbi:MAG: hypothetical protein J6D03_10545 [Clostridia bacterium]|nr:hypothetical protein [Clostridia bacterium]
MKNLRGWNEFGIDPTTNYSAAGYDFYVPNLKTTTQKHKALNAFKKSYKKSDDEMNDIISILSTYVASKYGRSVVEENIENILMLYLALDSNYIRNSKNEDEKIFKFVDNYLIFDELGIPGIECKFSDHLLICSGIHVCLSHDTAGIFYNKSGMGNRGWDTRACVVDEDYAGICHLSASYTKQGVNGRFYCGDKFSQMVIEVIERGEKFENMTQEEYEEAMNDSQRGETGFGNSDIKH